MSTRLDSVKIRWNEVKRLNDGFATRIKLAALSVSGEMSRLTTLQDGSQGFGRNMNPKSYLKVKRRKAVRRSSKGESPFRQTGKLSQTMQIQIMKNGLTARIGPGVIYGTILELGLDRPHIRLSLTNTTTTVRRILST
jgi:hypothetical protein